MLKEALKIESKQVLFSKEVIGSFLVSAGNAAAGLHLSSFSPSLEAFGGAAASLAIAGLLSNKSKFAASRRKLLTEHPMAYLYEAKGKLRY